jgi:hypothetical protein
MKKEVKFLKNEMFISMGILERKMLVGGSILKTSYLVWRRNYVI